MKKLFLLWLFPSILLGQEFGTFAVNNTDFKEIFNNYRTGSPDKIPWVGSWWSFKRNGTTYNGMYGTGSKKLGPTQKFDKFFKLGRQTTSWEAANNTCDKITDKKRKDSCKGWWGHCNAWAAAAIKEDEPRKSFQARDDAGKVYEMTVADQKALLTEIYMENSSAFVGKRSNEEDGDWVFDKNHKTSKELKDARYPSSGTKYDAFWDVSPKQLFYILTNYVGIRRVGVVIDRYTGSQVWNQPIAGYRILPILKDHIKKPEVRDGKTVYPVYLRLKMFWAEDGVGELEISESFNINRTSEEFKYKEHYNKHYSGRTLAFYLFFDRKMKVSNDGKRVISAGKVIGDGVWYHQTAEGAKGWKGVIKNSHPDFIWFPEAAISKRKNRNRPPVLTEARVRKIFRDQKEIKDAREKLENRVDNINSLAKFQKLQKDVIAFWKKGHIGQGEAIDLLMNLKENASIFVKSPNDFLMLAATNQDKATKKLKVENSKFIAKNLDLFFSLNPGVNSIVKLQVEVAGSLNVLLALKERGLSKTKKPSQFIKIFEVGTNKKSKGLAAFANNQIDGFMLLGPSVNEILSFQAILLNVGAGFNTIYKLKEMGIKNASRYQDYVALLDLGMKNPPRAYKKLVYNLAKENPFQNPDAEGLLIVDETMSFSKFLSNHQMVVKRLNYSYSDIMGHKKDGLKLLTKPKQMVELISPRIESVSIRYQNLIDSFISRHIKEMIKKTNPSIKDVMKLHKFIEDNDVDMEIKRKALNLLKSSDELILLLDPGKLKSSDDYLESISKFLRKNITFIREKSNSSLKIWMGLTRYSKSIDTFMAIKEEAINLVKTSDDIGIVLGMGSVGNPNSDLSSKLEDFLLDNIQKMVGMVKPSSFELVALTDFARTNKARISIKKAGRPYVQTLEDFAILLDPYVDGPSDEYINLIEEFKKDNPFKDAEGNIVDVPYQNCTYFLQTLVRKKEKGKFLASSYNKEFACEKALKKCKKARKWTWKCRK